MNAFYPKGLAEQEDRLINIRRNAVGKPGLEGKPRVGVALSGGGIRSATFSLGVFQALAGKGLLRRIDFLSTVSGGGYFGGFLGRLFTRPWVSGFFTRKDFSEPSKLVEMLSAQNAAAYSRFLWGQFEIQEQEALTDNDASPDDKRTVLVKGFNRILEHPWNFKRDLSDFLEALPKERHEFYHEHVSPAGDCPIWLFRVLLGETYPGKIKLCACPPGTRKLRRSERYGVGRVEAELRDSLGSVKFLRDNGRYLSPNGAGDTWTIVALLLRNWLSIMVVLFTLAWGVFLSMALVRAVLWKWEWTGSLERHLMEATDKHLWWSPVLALPAVVLALLVVPLGWAYWLTQTTWSESRHKWLCKLEEPVAPVTAWVVLAGAAAWVQWGGLSLATSLVACLVGLEAALTLICYGVFRVAADWSKEGSYRDRYYQVRNWLSHWLSGALAVTVGLLALAIVDSLGQTCYALMHEVDSRAALKALGGLLGIPALALGASRLSFLLDRLPKHRAVQLPLDVAAGLAALALALVWLTLASMGAYAVAWHGETPRLSLKRGRVEAVIQPGANLEAQVYPAITNLVTLTPEHYIQVVTPKESTPQGKGRSRPGVVLLALAWLAAAGLSLLFGHTRAFVNLSSLHAFYTARLTRAYLGASNERRWPDDDDERTSQRISDPVAGDDMEWNKYQPWFAGGPLHLVNVTINETVSGKTQVEYRDRKGLILAVGPCGLSAGARDHGRWNDTPPVKPEPDEPVEPSRPSVNITPLDTLPGRFQALGVAEEGADLETRAPGKTHPCEPASLGRWVGISGAAFSTGLGCRTSLAKSLLLGLLNVRLGYWWNSGIKYRERVEAKACTPPRLWNWIARLLAKVLPVQTHLLQELTARFQGPVLKLWYVSDGGHFENTAAYELLRRRLPFIVVCDNGCDPNYAFEDAANLVRKARLDFGAEAVFLNDGELEKLGVPSAVREWIGMPEDFRRKPQPGEDPNAPRRTTRHALLARVSYPVEGAENPHHKAAGSTVSYILFLKPSVTGDEPLDVLQYQKEHPEFPNESTADQYFNEAQWESYRKLGEHIAEHVLACQPHPPWFFELEAK
jgi:hypothetical protein